MCLARLTRAFFFPENDRKFIAADAGDKIVLAAALSHQGCGLAQDVVAHAVAELVVVSLEIVDVEEQQSHAEAKRARLLDDLVEEVLEVTAVVQTRELIGDGELL